MKLEAHSKIREAISFENNIPIRIFRGYDCGKSLIIPHMHEAIEIIYITEGELQILDSTNKFNLFSGEFHIFNSNSVHSTSFNGQILKGIILQISFDLIKRVVPDATHYRFYFSNGSVKAKNAVIKLLKSLLNQSENPERFGYLNSYGDLMHLLNLLFKYFSEKVPEQALHLNQKYYDRIFKINNFIERNYAKKITLTRLSREVHLNPEYLSRFISKHYGMSFYAYLTNVRLNHADSLLSTTDIPILEIAEQTGFANYAQFNKEFKKRFDKLPSQNRKEQS
ncbi:hypothetical protein N692_14365 [Lactiplantibacillus plantarum EGD-AQ4]|nr:hypothetical protein N692_14365 [Lactiplantibacillus plantarum EGD-AQ4]